MSKRHRRERQEPPTPAEDEGLWVTTEREILLSNGRGGGYRTVIRVDKDWAVSLSPEGALKYCLVCLEAAARVEYDAAVFAQMTRRLTLEPAAAAGFVQRDLRPDRPELDDAAPGLRFEPGITEAGKPFIHITINGDEAGQLDPDQLRQHAMHVLETPIAAELDDGYRRALVGVIGVEEARAAAAIEDLASHRWKFR